MQSAPNSAADNIRRSKNESNDRFDFRDRGIKDTIIVKLDEEHDINDMDEAYNDDDDEEAYQNNDDDVDNDEDDDDDDETYIQYETRDIRQERRHLGTGWN